MPFVREDDRFRFWSLREIMRVFDAWGIAMLLHHIDEKRAFAKKMCDGGDRDHELDAKEKDLFVEPILGMASYLAEHAQLQSTYDRVWANGPFRMTAAVSITYAQLESELGFLRQTIEADLEKHLFAFVVPDKARMFHEMPKKWAEIWKQVPASIDDSKHAIECYALEQETACVFHSMRVVEWGLRAFCAHLGFNEVRVFHKGSQATEFVPVEYNTWEIILNQLPDKIEAKLKGMQKGPDKQQAQEFYNSVLIDVRSIKDAWRNHVMHSRSVYTPEDAMAIMSHVKRIMDALASKQTFDVLQEIDETKNE